MIWGDLQKTESGDSVHDWSASGTRTRHLLWDNLQLSWSRRLRA